MKMLESVKADSNNWEMHSKAFAEAIKHLFSRFSDIFAAI